MSGVFVTIEGVDGAGKSTQAKRLQARLTEIGYETTLTREPGGAPGAEEIRKLLLTGDGDRWSPISETLLFFAARRDHLERTIAPALARGAVVICDRFTDSTRAYQSAGRAAANGASRDLIDTLHREAIGLDPDLTLIFDMDPDVALSRGLARETDEARFEGLGGAFQTKLRHAFREIAAQDPARCEIIDASGAEDDVAARVWAAVEPRL